MIRKVGSVLLLAVGALLLIGRVDVWQIRANEYFGDAGMIAISTQPSAPQAGSSTVSAGSFAGIIRGWGWYAIYGTAEDCRIVPILSPVGDAAKVRCGMDFNEKATVFRGWMEFRGHPRPFCGTKTGEFPRKCFGEW